MKVYTKKKISIHIEKIKESKITSEVLQMSQSPGKVMLSATVGISDTNLAKISWKK